MEGEGRRAGENKVHGRGGEEKGVEKMKNKNKLSSEVLAM